MRLGPYILGPTEDENQGIYTGDARVLAEAIPDESVDLIFTDPVYDRIDDYRWLAEVGVRVLRPNRACLVFCGIGYLPETLDALRAGGLSYHWRLDANYAARKQYHGKLQVSSTLCLWMEKGRSQPLAPVGDSTTLPHDREARYLQRNGASWDKHPKIVRRYIQAFCEPRGVTLDLYSGLGTIPRFCCLLGRRYLAFEIDPDVVDIARERVRNTQPPLFIPEPEQLALEGIT